MTLPRSSIDVVACPQCGAQVPPATDRCTPTSCRGWVLGALRRGAGARVRGPALRAAAPAGGRRLRRAAPRAGGRPARVQSVAVHLIGLHLALGPESAHEETTIGTFAPLLRAARGSECRVPRAPPAHPPGRHHGGRRARGECTAVARTRTTLLQCGVGGRGVASMGPRTASIRRWAALLLFSLGRRYGAAPPRPGRREHEPPHAARRRRPLLTLALPREVAAPPPGSVRARRRGVTLANRSPAELHRRAVVWIKSDGDAPAHCYLLSDKQNACQRSCVVPHRTRGRRPCGTAPTWRPREAARVTPRRTHRTHGSDPSAAHRATLPLPATADARCPSRSRRRGGDVGVSPEEVLRATGKHSASVHVLAHAARRARHGLAHADIGKRLQGPRRPT
jgi:hypothetical protein